MPILLQSYTYCRFWDCSSHRTFLFFSFFPRKVVFGRAIALLESSTMTEGAPHEGKIRTTTHAGMNPTTDFLPTKAGEHVQRKRRLWKYLVDVFP